RTFFHITYQTFRAGTVNIECHPAGGIGNTPFEVVTSDGRGIKSFASTVLAAAELYADNAKTADKRLRYVFFTVISDF
ncbi:MAG: hypothetical protein K2M67_08890, partial [Muribaculaceae bacterium]|nr:hypothetical protein [Muribaculaceae bacterium]